MLDLVQVRRSAADEQEEEEMMNMSEKIARLAAYYQCSVDAIAERNGEGSFGELDFHCNVRGVCECCQQEFEVRIRGTNERPPAPYAGLSNAQCICGLCAAFMAKHCSKFSSVLPVDPCRVYVSSCIWCFKEYVRAHPPMADDHVQMCNPCLAQQAAEHGH